MKRLPSSLRLEDLCNALNLQFVGNGDQVISNIAPLDQMDNGSLSFMTNVRYQKYLAGLENCTVVLAEKYAQNLKCSAILAENPYLTYARVASHLFPTDFGEPSLHPHSDVDPSAKLGKGTCVSANVSIGAGTELGENVFVAPGVVIGKNVRVGDGCYIYPNVCICDDTLVGKRAILYPGAVLGADGFGLANDGGKWVRVPQLGRVVLGDDVEIGVNTTIDRGALEDTVIASGAKLDNQVHVAHNVHIGENTAIAGQVGIAGSTSIGAGCTFGGAIAVNGHIEIGDNVHVTGMSMVTHNLTKPGVYSSGIPADENRKWRRNVARFQHLDELAKKIKAIENRLSDLDD